MEWQPFGSAVWERHSPQCGSSLLLPLQLCALSFLCVKSSLISCPHSLSSHPIFAKLIRSYFTEAVLSPTPKISPALKKRAAQIKLFLMDVDGTITHGAVLLLSQPDCSPLEIKKFHPHAGPP